MTRRRFPGATVMRRPFPEGTPMELLIGALLALAVGVFGTHAGFDRERGFYPVILIVIASYYVLFALQGGAANAWVPEVLVMAGFVVAAMLGFRWSLWLVVAALFGHGVLDAVHPHLLPHSGAQQQHRSQGGEAAQAAGLIRTGGFHVGLPMRVGVLRRRISRTAR